MPGELTFPDPRLNELLGTLQKLAPQTVELYLVGGAVRDYLRGKPVHDLDLVLTGPVRNLARQVANALGGSFYMLDESRDTARVIDRVKDPGQSTFLDFCALRAPDLETDLRDRDFTVNAIAIDLRHPERLIDPTGGAADLRAKILRACSPQSVSNDPVRVLRGVRLALDLGYRIDPQTLAWITQAAPLLPRVSRERQRDELFRMLDGGQAAAAVRLLEHIGVLPVLLPELVALKGIQQSPPHTLDVWEHTLAVLNELQRLWAALVEPNTEDATANLMMGVAALHLGRFRQALREHFAAALNPNRSLRGLLFLAGLYHDMAKPETHSVDADGRIRAFGHEASGAERAAQRARELALSQVEVQRVETIIRNHMRIHHLASAGENPSRRAIYRYFRDTGPAGVDLALLSLADTLATYGVTMAMPVWEAELATVRILFEAWFERQDQEIQPPRLLTGRQLMDEFHLPPGPEVGRLLSSLQEAQAVGEVTNRQEAIAYVGAILAKGALKDIPGEPS